jgi:taurine dioxygenase
MTVTVTPLTDALGAEATGVDFRHGVTEADLAALKQGLSDHLVLVIRDQQLTPDQYLAALRLFGDTMDQHLTDMLMKTHPEIAVLDSSKVGADSNGKIYPAGSRDWHTDHTNHAKPPKFTALYALTLPKSGGGDTGFANMHLALENLPAAQRAKMAEMKTVNKIEDKAYVSAEHKKKFGVLQSHPLLRTHPETGRKAIYIHPGKLERIEGMTPEASHVFSDDLMEQVMQPDIIYRHKWRAGDMTLWDNRCVLHLAHRDYDPAEGRVMHRVLLKGDKPY